MIGLRESGNPKVHILRIILDFIGGSQVLSGDVEEIIQGRSPFFFFGGPDIFLCGAFTSSKTCRLSDF